MKHTQTRMKLNVLAPHCILSLLDASMKGARPPLFSSEPAVVPAEVENRSTSVGCQRG